jgi:hypothetical protein
VDRLGWVEQSPHYVSFIDQSVEATARLFVADRLIAPFELSKQSKLIIGQLRHEGLRWFGPKVAHLSTAGDCCAAGLRPSLSLQWVRLDLVGRGDTRINVRSAPNTDHKIGASASVALCQEATYAVQQIAAYSITSSARRGRKGWIVLLHRPDGEVVYIKLDQIVFVMSAKNSGAAERARSKVQLLNGQSDVRESVEEVMETIENDSLLAKNGT